MDIKEILRHKKELEAALSQAVGEVLTTFQKETELHVMEVDVQSRDVRPFGRDNQFYAPVDVTVYLDLGL